jgi:hypothetical protein
MIGARALERQAIELERQAAEARSVVTDRRDIVETPLMRANRLAGEAAEARAAADRAKRRLSLRLLWIAVRVAFLAFLLWGFWRVGYVAGHLA